MDELQKLQNNPTPEELDLITTQYLKSDSPALHTRLQFINTYLKHIIPIYENLKPSLRLKILELFQSSVGISNLLSYYKLTQNDIYLKVMKDLLISPLFLVNVIKASNEGELSHVRSLFFGSKIFQTFQGKLDFDKYQTLLVDQVLQVCKAEEINSLADFILPLLSLHPVESKKYFFDTFLTEKNFQYLIKIYRMMNTFQQKTFFIKYLLAYLDPLISLNNMETSAKILLEFEPKKFECALAKHIAESSNTELQIVVSLAFENPKTQFNTLLAIWGDTQFIKENTSSLQECYTKEMLVLLNHISSEEKAEISKNRTFLDSITSRLSSNESKNRDYAMTVAKVVTDGAIKMDIENEIVIPKFALTDPHSSPIDFAELRAMNQKNHLELYNKKHMEHADSDDDEDVDADDDFDIYEDQQSVFLKDLIAKFNKERIISITKLLQETITLVRRKATFKLEVEYYSEDLVLILCGLFNKYDEQNFEELKISALVSVIVVVPKTISYVMTLLFTGDYSLQQRMMILSSIALSARELRGLEDDFIEAPSFDFPTQQIKQRHEVPKIEEIFSNLEIERQNAIGSGTVIRKSSKLTKSSEIKKSKPNNFSKIGSKWFYALANGWAQGIDLGTHNEVFLKHYLQTMSLVLKASYPCYEYEDMLATYKEIMVSTTLT